jgi:magnesium transporter
MQTATSRTARDLMSTAIMTAGADEPVRSVLARFPLERPVSAGHVFLVDETGRLAGQAPIESVLAADPETRLGDLRGEPPVVVRPGDPAESVALLALSRHDADVAVVEDGGRLVGAIPIGRLLALLHEEHLDDMLRMSGLGPTHPAPTEERDLLRSLGARLPWLLIGLVGGMAAGGVVGAFEQALERELTLAFFIPLVVYMADAVGTQTETVLVRALAHGSVPVVAEVVREGLLGLMIGLSLGALAAAGLFVVGTAPDVVAVIGITLAITALMATVVASLFPLGLARLGVDPALASGPVATVVQDILSVAVYLGVATLLL